MESHPRATLSRLAILILQRHDTITEITLSHVEVQTVHGYKLRKGDIISLLLLVLQVVAKHKARFLGGMCMEVHKHISVFICVGMLDNQLFYSPDRGVFCLYGVQIVAI
jgi:hypothetical protein